MTMNAPDLGARTAGSVQPTPPPITDRYDRRRPSPEQLVVLASREARSMRRAGHDITRDEVIGAWLSGVDPSDIATGGDHA